jgi:hypothetical protein
MASDHPPETIADTRSTPAKYPSDRSERALALIAEGRFGGAGRGQGRKPKGHTASEQVADLAEREAPAIKRAFSDGLRSRNERTRILAAKELLAQERREQDRHPLEDYFRALPEDELDRQLTEAFVSIADHLGIDVSLLLERPKIVDADVVEDPPSQVPRLPPVAGVESGEA